MRWCRFTLYKLCSILRFTSLGVRWRRSPRGGAEQFVNYLVRLGGASGWKGQRLISERASTVDIASAHTYAHQHDYLYQYRQDGSCTCETDVNRKLDVETYHTSDHGYQYEY